MPRPEARRIRTAKQWGRIAAWSQKTHAHGKHLARTPGESSAVVLERLRERRNRLQALVNRRLAKELPGLTIHRVLKRLGSDWVHALSEIAKPREEKGDRSRVFIIRGKLWLFTQGQTKTLVARARPKIEQDLLKLAGQLGLAYRWRDSYLGDQKEAMPKILRMLGEDVLKIYAEERHGTIDSRLVALTVRQVVPTLAGNTPVPQLIDLFIRTFDARVRQTRTDRLTPTRTETGRARGLRWQPPAGKPMGAPAIIETTKERGNERAPPQKPYGFTGQVGKAFRSAGFNERYLDIMQRAGIRLPAMTKPAQAAQLAGNISFLLGLLAEIRGDAAPGIALRTAIETSRGVQDGIWERLSQFGVHLAQ